MPDSSQAFFGFGDAVAEAFIYDEAGGHISILKAAVQFISVGDGHAVVKFAMLDKGRCFSLVDGSNRRSLFVNGFVFPGGSFQILAGEGGDVG